MSDLNDFLIASSLINPLKCEVCADAVGYSLMINVETVHIIERYTDKHMNMIIEMDA